jgi:hypothetical protein
MATYVALWSAPAHPRPAHRRRVAVVEFGTIFGNEVGVKPARSVDSDLFDRYSDGLCQQHASEPEEEGHFLGVIPLLSA